jgi:hypothetical protein
VIDEARLKEIENKLQEVAAKLLDAAERASHASHIRIEIERQIARVREIQAEIEVRLARVAERDPRGR